MLNPDRLLQTPCLVYPAADDDDRDEYNNPVLGTGAPVATKCWLHQVQTDELTLGTDQASERWAIYLPLDTGVSFVAVVEVAELSLRLQVRGAPHVWRHPTRGPLFVELEAEQLDDGWVS